LARRQSYYPELFRGDWIETIGRQLFSPPYRVYHIGRKSTTNYVDLVHFNLEANFCYNQNSTLKDCSARKLQLSRA
jgi:hypothetical protein